MRFLLLIVLASCQDMRTRFHPRTVADAYAFTFVQIASAVNKSLGYECLQLDATEGEGAIVIDDALLAELKTADPNNHAEGAFLIQTRTVVMSTPIGNLPRDPLGTCATHNTCNVATMLLAHELGHALGLEHADSGLMHPNGDDSCVGDEARCLVVALRAQELAL